jgi:hypothetical protein
MTTTAHLRGAVNRLRTWGRDRREHVQALAVYHGHGTVAHRVDLGMPELANTPAAWDRLRSGTGAYHAPTTPTELQAAAWQHPELAARARAVDDHLEQVGARTAASYGVGSGLLEWWLLEHNPSRPLTITEFAPTSLEILHASLPTARVEGHDLLTDGPLDVDVHVFHRVDTEFTNEQWHDIYARFARERILVAISELLTVERILERRSQREDLTKAGWLRTRRAVERLWSATHTATPTRIGDLDGWDLRPRSGRPGSAADQTP